MNDCIGEDHREQEVLLTSHSPFIVSDCRPSKVYSFKRNSRGKIIFEQPDFNTLGASVNLISAKVFGKTETISSFATEKIKSIQKKLSQNKIEVEEALKEANSLGDSVEKVILINQIRSKRK